jgi:FAD-linked oxidoreductase
MRRRDFLAASAGVLAGAALPGCGEQAEPERALPRPRQIPWRNWSGYQQCQPAQRVAPASLDELASLLRGAQGPVRPVGAGHSFTPLVPTDGTIVSLRNFTGLRAHDAAALTATFGAGTKLGQIGGPLDAVGQALPNMPDIDEQSLAGAISTGTHGTGAKLGALHSRVTALQLVTPRGEVLECSRAKNAAIFDAARVSLGSLGIITAVTLANEPTHKLKRTEWFEPLDTLLERFDELAARHHSFELYFFPSCDLGWAITIDPTDEPVSERPPQKDEEGALALKQARDLLAWWPWLRRRLTNDGMRELAEAGGSFTSVDIWYRIFPSARSTRFNEMEYHLPREQLIPTVHRVREVLDTRHPEIFFPVEVRVVKGDDAWLSPFHGHESSGSIAVHHYYPEDPLPYFADVEPLYRPLGGRPHWGKMNTLAAADFARLYPRWQDFLAVREQLDPEGRMLNPYLRQVFGA